MKSKRKGTKKNKRTRKKRGGDGEYNEPCAICVGERTATHQFCANNHYFCPECTIQWLINVHNNMAGCPLCRAPYGRGYGHWIERELDHNNPPQMSSLTYTDVTGECCSPCEKTCWDKLTCSRTECYPCLKDDNGFITGESKYEKKCKKHTEGGRRKKKTRKKKKQFLYNPDDPSKSFDVYIDKNPNDTIPIKYTTVKDVEDTIKKLERLYKTKKYPHKRIWQVGMIMKVRLEAMNKYKKTRYPNAKNVYKRFQLSKKYFKFLGKRSKKKTFEDRKKMTFNINMKKKKTRRGGGKNKRKNKTKKNKSTKKMDKDFKPNLTPRQMFKMGSFGGTYWRPIKSKFNNTTLKNKHKKYSFLKDIPDKLMTKPFDEYDKKLNKYKKKVGTTLKFWESKGWMKESHPYGWVQWYCDYYSGKRSADDERQIKRWKQLAGPNGRFRKWLITMIMKKGGKKDWDNDEISPAIRQTLQHWGYKLTKKDFDKELADRKNKSR